MSRINHHLGISVCFCLLFSLISRGQVFQRPSLIFNLGQIPNDTLTPTTSFAGNYNLLTDFDTTQLPLFLNRQLELTYTLFFVLKKNTPSYSTDSIYFKLNQSIITEELYSSNSIEFFDLDTSSNPIIVCIKGVAQSNRQLKNLNLSFLNTAIFDLFEITFFNEILDDRLTRQYETYLALKYSINISQNTDPSKRDYFYDPINPLVWSSVSEANYDKNIVAIGSIPDAHWEQGQTATNSTNLPFIGSLSDSLSLGQFPQFTTPLHNELLVFSQKLPNTTNPSSNCLSLSFIDSIEIYNWKFRTYDWHIARDIHIACEGLTTLDSVYLTDGVSANLLNGSIKPNGLYMLDIPSTLLHSNRSYFFARSFSVIANCSDSVWEYDQGVEYFDPSENDSNSNMMFVDMNSYELYYSLSSLQPGGQYFLITNQGSPLALLGFNSSSFMQRVNHSSIQVEVYPNPTDAYSFTNVSIQSNSQKESRTQLKLYNALGQIIHQLETSKNSVQIQVANPGVYLLLVSTEGQTIVSKVIVK